MKWSLWITWDPTCSSFIDSATRNLGKQWADDRVKKIWESRANESQPIINEINQLTRNQPTYTGPMYWFILYKPCTNVPFKSLCHVDLPSGKRHPTTTPLQISRRIDGRNTTHSQVKGLVRGNPLGDTNKSLGNKQTTHFQRDFHHPLPGSAKNSMVYLIVGRCLYFCFLCVCVCLGRPLMI